MDAGLLQRSIFIVFVCLFCVLGWGCGGAGGGGGGACGCKKTSIAQKPSTEVIWQSERPPYEEDETIFSSPGSETQLDVNPGPVPIVNPTTPTTATPIVNPTSPPAPTTPEPVTNPVTNPTPTPTTTTPASTGGAWCVANPTASPTALQVALDYACGYGGADCSGIQPGAPCYDPITVKDHASYAFNDYYQKNPIPTSCVFGGTAQLTYTDPSYGNCHFASPNKTPTTTPTPPTVPMTPPSTTTPINPYTPNGPTGYGTEPTDYGSEPTGTPNSAKIASSNLQQLLVGTCLMLWVTTANYL